MISIQNDHNVATSECFKVTLINASDAIEIIRGVPVNQALMVDRMLMRLLNPGYESESVVGSLYWNNASKTCYNSNNNSTTS